MPEMYRVCDSREEAEGLARAIAERLGGRIVEFREDRKLVGLTCNPTRVGMTIHETSGEVEVLLRKSQADDGKFQMRIRAVRLEDYENVLAALGRRKGRRIAWPVRAA